MLIYILLIILGFLVLIKSADWLVEHSASLAKKIGISPLLIGLTVVAFGTSAPELIVNIISSLKGSSEIVIGNIIGSNIANICLVIGLGALILPLKIKSQTLFKELPLMILGGFGFSILVLDKIINSESINQITTGDGIILLLLFVVFLYYTILSALSHKDKNQKDFDESIKTHPGLVSLLFIIVSMLGLFIGGRLVVTQAINLAVLLNVSQKLIGLTIVAIGTSLPEIITTIIAATKKQTDIAVGNVVGSNIFNITFVLGISAIISPIKLETAINFDLAVMMISFLLLVLFSFTKRRVQPWEGFTLLIIYALYMLLLIFRG